VKLFCVEVKKVRVVAGILGSRPLASPPDGVRPTSDRVRESLFSRLGDLADRSVLDLFAGTGALGIEAISRGARRATFVERAAPALKVLTKNLRTLDIEARSEVIRGDVAKGLRRLSKRGDRFDLILMDPPYDADVFGQTIAQIGAANLLEASGTLVVESAKRHPLPSVVGTGLEVIDERVMGDTVITWLGTVQGVEMAKSSAGSETGPIRRAEDSAEVVRPATIALFPASFDPPTNGHIDLIQRARQAFDTVVVAVAINVGKTGCFSYEERIDMLEAVTAGMDGVRVEGFSGLVVEHARSMGATVIIRGLRAIADFEYEFEMALMNRHLEPDVETIFLMTRQEYLYVSSSRLKELVRFGANIDDFVPELIAKRLYEKLGTE
jgi:pantetheine-phosphate adenylyltransferase